MTSLTPKNYVAGHCGMVGSAIVRTLQQQGQTSIVTRTHAALDLMNQASVNAFFELEKPDQVYLAGAKVGGVHANNTYPAESTYQNLMVHANVIDAAFRNGVQKLLFLGSSCIYPKLAPQPMAEDALLTGALEPTNEPYAIAKIAGIKLYESYNRQYGASHSVDYRSVMPANLSGLGDNHCPENSHVIPALIHRFHEAKVSQAPTVTIWGYGTPRSEFLYVDDIAAASVFVMNLPKATLAAHTQPMQSRINFGFGDDITIKELALAVSKIVGYQGVIDFDATKPDGLLRKLMDKLPFKCAGLASPSRARHRFDRCVPRFSSYVIASAARHAILNRTMKKNSKVALITGVTSQDGSYFAEFLLEKGYTVHGIKRRASSFNTQLVDHIYQDPHVDNAQFKLHYGDLSDSSNLTRIIQETQPDEIYNLGTQSHVAVSFESPRYTADVDGMGTLCILEVIRILGLEKNPRFYQSSTSELYCLAQETPQKETTPFCLCIPYAVAKLYAYWITVNYRAAHGMYACKGILFNHESPRRGETFVTRKITRGMANIIQGVEGCLYMRNIDALRDWGHAKDYVRMQWMMLQQNTAEDFVIAMGKQYSVWQFIEWTAAELGIQISWLGVGVNEVSYVNVKATVRIDPCYFCPTEVETLLGDPSKAKQKLGGVPEITAQEMCDEMVAHDLVQTKQHALLKQHGYSVNVSVE